MFFQSLRISLVMIVLFTVLLCGIYPAIVTGVSALVFADKAAGSLIITSEGKVQGSSLIGQEFSDPKYFWGRLSATSPAYNAAVSSGSNLGVNSPNLASAIEGRIKALKDKEPAKNKPIPVDLVTASGSGLDPHLSPAAVEYQIPRVAKLRGISVEKLQELVNSHTEKRMGGILGEPRVNILQLNLDIDAVSKGK
jgi:K+-transporting ATPase ATPase C chain